VTTLDELFTSRIAVVVPEAIGPTAAAELRARLAHTGYARYALLDRGSYDLLASPDEPAVLEALTGIAAQITDRALVVADARAVRLHPGDYLLAHHDRVHDDPLVELMLDLSPAGVPGAEVHYRRHGQVVFRFASRPGAVSVVERGPAVTCHHTYVSQRHAGASVVRLIVRLRGA
jgi:hypothetical protein